MATSTCTKCGSTRIIPDADITDLSSAGPIAVCVNANPEAILFKGTHTGYLKAWICGDCGYTELYVDKANELYEAYSKSQQLVGLTQQ
jgi:predicted nucleic-acid-binding Zn-ribbon protein